MTGRSERLICLFVCFLVSLHVHVTVQYSLSLMAKCLVNIRHSLGDSCDSNDSSVSSDSSAPSDDGVSSDGSGSSVSSDTSVSCPRQQ